MPELLTLDTAGFRAAASADQPLIVMFCAPDCGPCGLMKPVLEQMAAGRSDVAIATCDITVAPDVAIEYRVMGVPMIYGVIAGQVQGAPLLGTVPPPKLAKLADDLVATAAG